MRRLRLPLAVILVAAIAAVGAIAIGATGDGTPSSLVPITPCRLVDTRPAPLTVGTRAAPIGSGETVAVQVTGTNGNCTIPTEATGIASNVTIVNPTAPSFLTVFPSDAPRPTASNLNWTPTSPPTPNQVTVALGGTGAVKVFNLTGTVDVIIDVVGYYLPSAGGATGPTGATGPAPTSRTITWPSGVNGPTGPTAIEYVGTYGITVTTDGCDLTDPDTTNDLRIEFVTLDGEERTYPASETCSSYEQYFWRGLGFVELDSVFPRDQYLVTGYRQRFTKWTFTDAYPVQQPALDTINPIGTELMQITCGFGTGDPDLPAVAAPGLIVSRLACWRGLPVDPAAYDQEFPPVMSPPVVVHRVPALGG